MSETSDIRVVATDLDGTLLNGKGIVSRRTRDALRHWTRHGGLVIGVTARAVRAVRHLSCHGMNGLVVCANGAVVFDLDVQEIVRSTLLPRQLSVDIVEAIRQIAPGAICAVEFPLHVARDEKYRLANPPAPHEERVGDVLELIDEDAAKLIVRHPTLSFGELLEAAKKAVGDSASVTHSTSEFVEISAFGIDKAITLAEVVDAYGLRCHNVIAFGDMPNDIPMLSWAGRSVAMGNAHAAVRDLAQEVTLSNEDDGVAVVIEQLLAESAPARPR